MSEDVFGHGEGSQQGRICAAELVGHSRGSGRGKAAKRRKNAAYGASRGSASHRRTQPRRGERKPLIDFIAATETDIPAWGCSDRLGRGRDWLGCRRMPNLRTAK